METGTLQNRKPIGINSRKEDQVTPGLWETRKLEESFSIGDS